jgi:hypothetical protein
MVLTVAVQVPPRDREILQGWLRSPSLCAGLAQRARIVLLAADGVGTGEIVPRRSTVPLGRSLPAQAVAGPCAGRPITTGATPSCIKEPSQRPSRLLGPIR